MDLSHGFQAIRLPDHLSSILAHSRTLTTSFSVGDLQVGDSQSVDPGRATLAWELITNAKYHTHHSSLPTESKTL